MDGFDGCSSGGHCHCCINKKRAHTLMSLPPRLEFEDTCVHGGGRRQRRLVSSGDQRRGECLRRIIMQDCVSTPDLSSRNNEVARLLGGMKTLKV